MIKFVTGNFFDYNADILINTVNCVGVMGAGVALQFKTKFPEMYKEYLKACNEGLVQPGKPHVWSNNTFFNEEDSLIIINFPTKNHWKKPSEYEYIEEGLKWLSKFLLNHTGKTITVPALGCGHGGLNWTVVKDMIIEYLSEIDLTILVFEPESSTKKDDLKIEMLLLENNVSKLTPHSYEYPSKLKGKLGAEIYIKGELNRINNKIFSLFVNSQPDDKEKKIVFDCLDSIDLKKYTFLLGYNNSFEIDIVKHLLSKEIPVIVVLPYSILNLKIRKDIVDFWNDNLVTIISTAEPDAKWNISDSIKSLKFRLKLSDIILFTFHDITTIMKYEKDISENDNQKFYINYWNEPVSFYNRINAKKIGKNKDTNKPNFAPITNLI